MVLEFVSIAAVCGSLGLLVQAIRQARSSNKVDADLMRALNQNHDSLVKLDQALGRVIGSVKYPPKPHPRSSSALLHARIAEWSAAEEATVFASSAHATAIASNPWRDLLEKNPELLRRQLEFEAINVAQDVHPRPPKPRPERRPRRRSEMTGRPLANAGNSHAAVGC